MLEQMIVGVHDMLEQMIGWSRCYVRVDDMLEQMICQSR